MHKYRYETGEMKAESNQSGKRKAASRIKGNPHSGFTLTELLVVITIIAILTSLITVAAVNALRTAKQARITMEMQLISNAL
jgi:prepilin-type N-terminal cleavage/methylation domain-containing protein